MYLRLPNTHYQIFYQEWTNKNIVQPAKEIVKEYVIEPLKKVYDGLTDGAKKLYDFFKDGHTITDEEVKLLVVGNMVAFIVALIAIKSFIGFLNKHGFKIFGYYRIALGIILLALIMSGYKLEIV